MNEFLDWVSNVFSGFSSAWGWLNTDLVTLGDFSFTPLFLITFTGLTAFIVIALVKWGVS